MSAKPAPHLEFAPPAPPGMGRAWGVAVAAHLALFLALGLVTDWPYEPKTQPAEAELWPAMPQTAAPRLQEPPPPPPTPEPEPQRAPPKPIKPAQPAPEPEPDNSLLDAQIALEKKKLEDQKKKEAAERERKALEKKKKEADEKAKKEKAAKEKAAQEKKELDKKKAAEKAKADEKKRQLEQAQKEKKDKATEALTETLRKEQIQRTQGMAGASGGPNATGTALKSSGPSGSPEYKARIAARIKNNIIYPGDVVGNPRAEVEIRVAPDGTITSRRIKTPSGNKAWDDAVLRAIDKTEILPKDADGRVPDPIEIGFRPMD